MICQKRVFLLNNVYFDQKLVSLCSNIRLLVRDEWGHAPISGFNWVADILDKDHKNAIRQNRKNNGTSLLCKKGLVAYRDTAWEFFCEDGTSKSNKQHIRASNR